MSILAALSPLDTDSHNGFGLLSGTSMSTPVVSGIVALLKSLHPKWSPAAVRSALVTTGSSILRPVLLLNSSYSLFVIRLIIFLLKLGEQVHPENPFLPKGQTRNLQIHLTMEEDL